MNSFMEKKMNLLTHFKKTSLILFCLLAFPLEKPLLKAALKRSYPNTTQTELTCFNATKTSVENAADARNRRNHVNVNA